MSPRSSPLGSPLMIPSQCGRPHPRGSVIGQVPGNLGHGSRPVQRCYMELHAAVIHLKEHRTGGRAHQVYPSSRDAKSLAGPDCNRDVILSWLEGLKHRPSAVVVSSVNTVPGDPGYSVDHSIADHKQPSAATALRKVGLNDARAVSPLSDQISFMPDHADAA